MHYVKPEKSNFKFSAGKLPSTGDLDVTMAFTQEIPGRVFSVSEWELSEEDIAEMMRTKRLYISIMGSGMPPIRPSSFDPFEYLGYYPAIVADGPNGGKQIFDPRENESFMLWMEQIAGEINIRPGLTDKLPASYMALETYRSIFHNGTSPAELVDSIVKVINEK